MYDREEVREIKNRIFENRPEFRKIEKKYGLLIGKKSIREANRISTSGTTHEPGFRITVRPKNN